MDRIQELEQQLAEVTKKRDRLAAKVQLAFDAAYNTPELNMGNYNDDDVRELNDGMIEVFQILDSPGEQSLAEHDAKVREPYEDLINFILSKEGDYDTDAEALEQIFQQCEAIRNLNTEGE
jgi:phage shock protein A